MADFDTAFERTLRCEGGYANDPVDRGGETWRGISRVHFPHWPGWALIDRARRAKTFPRNLDSSRRLAECVSTFYREQFWNRIEGKKNLRAALTNPAGDKRKRNTENLLL